MASRRRTLIVSVILAAAMLAGTGALGVARFQSAKEAFWRDKLPAGLEVESLEYRKTADYGFGPGGNSAGIVVYRLRYGSAEQFLARGLDTAGRDGSHARRWRYWNWRPTPVAFDARWTRHGDHICGREPGIGAYIDYGDIRCTVDPAVIARVNRIVTGPGAYYAYGSASSVIVVAPAEALVILAFNG